MSTVACIIPAGGIGTRMGLPMPKQLLQLHGKSVIAHTLSNMKKICAVNLIVVVTSTRLLEQIQAEADQVIKECDLPTTSGGCPIETIVRVGVDSRHSSIKTGVNHLKGRGFQTLIVHDAVRPLVPPDLVETLLKASDETGAAGPWISLVSTVLKIDSKGLMQSTIPRYPTENGDRFVASEMPQVFRYEVLQEAYEKCDEHELVHGTECLELVRRYCGIQPRMFEGNRDKLWKITRQADLTIAMNALGSNQ